MGTPRNFACPMTGEVCVEGDCTRNALCIGKQRATTEEQRREAADFERRLRHGRVSAEELDL